MDLNNQEVRAQMKAEVVDRLGKIIADTKSLDLGHGRVILETAFAANSVELLMWFDALYEAGCVVLTQCEHSLHPRVVGGQPTLQVHLVFRLPRVTS